MGRRATGGVYRRETKSGPVWRARIPLGNGKRRQITLGAEADGWTEDKARDELAFILAKVKRGQWTPPQPEPVPSVEEPEPAPTLHEFASSWLANREPELRPKTVARYRWELTNHLLPYFARHRLTQITPAEVDDYKAAKLREGTIGPNQINKTIALLAQLMDDAGDYGLFNGRNPARGKRRRVKSTPPNRPALEPEQFPALLDEAGAMAPLIATLAGAGLRNGEACALEWRDVNLAAGTLTVRASKTNAGVRQVDMPDALREALSEHKAGALRAAPTDPVFTNRNGERQDVSNVGRRLKFIVRRANARLEERGIEPISESVTPHSLRRLYASLRFALGDNPVIVAEQMGHESGQFSMEVYARAVKRRERLSGATLEQFDRAGELARIGTIAPERSLEGADSLPSAIAETAWQSHKLPLGPDSSAG